MSPLRTLQRLWSALQHEASNQTPALRVQPKRQLTLERLEDRSVLADGNSGTRTFTFTVSLTSPSSQPVTVNYATANGTAKSPSDYQAKTGSLVFAPGQTSRTIQIVVKGDRASEDHETFFVNLSNAAGAGIVDGQGLGTILNDDGRFGFLSASAVDQAMANEAWLFDLLDTGNPGRRRA